MEYFAKTYDVAIIGAGHAGIEAGLAAARMGVSTVVFTISADWVGNCPCNTAIGGTSKGTLVKEIDALGGEMGLATDHNMIQSRMLNLGKGPAVHSPRAQVDRRDYSAYMKNTLETCENLDLRQAEIVDLKQGEDGLWELKTKLEAIYTAKCVVIATGTFLRGKIYVGEVNYDSGPDGMFPSIDLSNALHKLGIVTRRFKTGTPSRANKRSINFENLEVQEADEKLVRFSHDKSFTPENKAVCHITYTNDETKKVILDNLDRSPLYNGSIEGIGPRYCPSIESKIMTFPNKERHQIFIEPCGLNTQEMYLQGLSSSLPEDVQLKFLRTIPGFENIEIIRTAYAIEYDCVDPTTLKPTLEFIDFPGLFGCGTFCSSSGYEEAAAQGIVAGINAALKVQGKPPFILDRASSYIGTLIDDLITKTLTEPYRMMTSRSEYRLVLRQDNADLRLTRFGYELGLISEERYKDVCEKQRLIDEEIERVKSVTIAPSEELNKLLVSRETSPMKTGTKLVELIRRPQLGYYDLAPFDATRPELPDDVCEEVEIEVKYEGYIKRQQAGINEMRRLEGKKLPENIDYTTITNLRLEAQEKLNKVRPESIGQASRIDGVSPADISVLLIYLGKEKL
ncbi:MAG: tRNA uridine-5-carboxymethylaminomethyl(34) synthesis enzyme MnmG [Oscillospiraceae bacterium]|nr:tRNA uridine-5-carboxymethylaminomethyl(34) synthesis enzyme MnmG [Candidatus Limimonas coprohippi]